jgi:hypothetical protein
VIRTPLKVLVCLTIMSVVAGASVGWGYNGTGAPGAPAIQGDALSVDPSVQSLPSARTMDRSATTRRTEPSYSRRQFPVGGSTNSQTTSKRSYGKNYGPRTGAVITTADPRVVVPPVSWNKDVGQSANLMAGCPVQACAPGGSGSEGLLDRMFGPFAPGGIGLGITGPTPFLPRAREKQVQVAARVWYPNLNSSTMQWGTLPPLGLSGSELDLHQDLHLRRHEYVLEAEVQCQLRPNWSARYSYMPISFKDNFTNDRIFWFGNQLWPIGLPMLTQWDRRIQRVELVYNWFQACHAVSSVFGGYQLIDDKLTVQCPQLAPFGVSRTRSGNYHMATAGMSVDRVVSQVGSQGIASVHCRWSVQFLEGFLGWDGFAAGRIAIPYCRGQFGYLEAGWRWIVLDRQMPSNTDKTSLDGPMASVGMVF